MRVKNGGKLLVTVKTGQLPNELGDVGHILVPNQVKGQTLEDEMMSIFRGRLAQRAGGINLELVEDHFVALQTVGSRKELHLMNGLLRLGGIRSCRSPYLMGVSEVTDRCVQISQTGLE